MGAVHTNSSNWGIGIERRMMKRTLMLVAVAVFGVAGQINAQDSGLSLEINGALAIPTGDLADDLDLGAGFGFGATFLFEAISGTLDLYLGADRHHFSVGDDVDEAVFTSRARQEGFRGGARAFFQPAGAARPFVEGGLVYQRVRGEVRGAGFTIAAESDMRLGFELGGGVLFEVPAIAPFRLVPAVKYRQHPVRFSELGESAESRTASSVIFELGVSYPF